MVVTLPVVLDRFQDHRENKQAEQRGDDDGINHGASSKGCFLSNHPPPQRVCQSRDLHKDCFGVLPTPHLGKEDGPAIPPLREVGSGGWLQTTWFDHSFR